jgi:hypothetical protein
LTSQRNTGLVRIGILSAEKEEEELYSNLAMSLLEKLCSTELTVIYHFFAFFIEFQTSIDKI